MSTSWSLTARQICTDALEHIGAVAAGETASAADMDVALRGLDGVLKELPVFGYNWPKLSGETAISWTSGQSVNLPADYYDYPVIWKTCEGKRVELTRIPHEKWGRMQDRFSATGDPTHFYIAPDRVLYFYPTPEADPSAYLQYQKVINDAELSVTPDVLQIWKNPLGYGVASEISLKFGVDQPTRVEIAQRWTEKRARALESSAGSERVEFTVDE